MLLESHIPNATAFRLKVLGVCLEGLEIIATHKSKAVFECFLVNKQS